MNTVKKKYQDVQKVVRDTGQLKAVHVHLHSNAVHVHLHSDIWIDIAEYLYPIENHILFLSFFFVTSA